ncbi:hypothetical protein [Paraburkholderia aromaticivorans]|uniref:hypothetical protein n=1 Tax=Paraburkholderia aromaticivorans TaxID=2026199 RepID=UPI0012FD2528|nr:hypothetical protein [Paraburkholderia aromaticivorans]
MQADIERAGLAQRSAAGRGARSCNTGFGLTGLLFQVWQVFAGQSGATRAVDGEA